MLPEKIRAEFHASGISDAMIELAGVRCVDGDEIHRILGWQSQKFPWRAGWAIPFRDVTGAETGVHRVKLDVPRSDAKGKPIKYESPRGVPNRAFFPPGFAGLTADPKTPILITEGEKKALAAAERGFATIGLVGVWGWQKKRTKRTAGTATGPRLLIDDLERMEWAARAVSLIFDSDAAGSIDIQRAENELGRILTAKGAKVAVVRLPSIAGSKTGLDDFLVHHGAAARDELQRLLAEARDHEDEPAPCTAFMLADRLISEKFTHPDGVTIRYHREEFLRWSDGRYVRLLGDDFELGTLAWLDAQIPGVRPALAREVCTCVAARVLVPADADPPIWLKLPQFRPQQVIAVRNGLLDVEALLSAKKDVLRPHTPLWFSTNALPFPFDPEADCPIWLAFLDEVLEGDTERIKLLQQWFGYNFLADTRFHKFLILIGEGANGKSVILAVLSALLGEQNISRVPLEAFGQRFGLWPTIGKLANIIAEVGEASRTDEGVFKAFIAGDPVSIDRKNLSVLCVRPTARVTIATNTLPSWKDRSDGIWRRQMVIPFRVQIPEERQDRTLAQRIIDAEASGILNWGLVGLGDLRARGEFVRPALSLDLQSEHRTDSNPARAFLRAECSWAPGSEVGSDLLYAAYSNWCTAHGYRPFGDAEFGKEIVRVFPHSGRVKHRVEGKELRFRTGIRCPAAGNAVGCDQ